MAEQILVTFNDPPSEKEMCSLRRSIQTARTFSLILCSHNETMKHNDTHTKKKPRFIGTLEWRGTGMRKLKTNSILLITYYF